MKNTTRPDIGQAPFCQSHQHDNQGSVTFTSLGKLGTHWVYLRFSNEESETPATACIPPGKKQQYTEPLLCPHYYAPNFGRPDNAKGPDRHVRYANFVLDARTVVRTGDEAIDSLYDITRRRMSLNRRVFNLKGGKLAYYCSSDTWCTSVAIVRSKIRSNAGFLGCSARACI